MRAKIRSRTMRREDRGERTMKVGDREIKLLNAERSVFL
jgi:hypothetical protein